MTIMMIVFLNLEDTGEMPPNKVTDDNGLPTLRDQLEILDNTNLDWIHGILLFDVLEDIVDEFKSYCGENGVDESGMGKCMDEFPPSPDHEQINRTGGTLKQDYYTLYNFMKELERTGVNVKDYMKSPIFPNIIKLVDDGTTDYNATGEYSPMRQDSEAVDVSERISEHKESKINPELEVGDKILVVNVNREVESNSIKYHIPPPELKPDLYVSYAVVEKESNGSESKYPFRYTLIPEDRYQDYLNGDYMVERNTAKLLFPWIYDWILDDEDIITEHKESKINPELRVGDIVRVIDVDGEHARMPKRFETYKVVNVGSSYDEYYDIVSYPEPGIKSDNPTKITHYGEGQSILSLYRGDTWIYGDIPMATKVDRKTISEHKETKINPELMVGDEIMVVSTEGIHDFGTPELFKPYLVIGIKYNHNASDTNRKNNRPDYDKPFYQIEPLGMTDDERTGAMLAGGGRERPMYIFSPDDGHSGSDQWILRKGFRRGEDLNETQGAASYYFQGKNNMTLKTPELEQDLKAFHGLEIDEEEELDEFCPMGSPNKCTPVDYDNLPDMLHEHEGGKNMKEFTPKLIGYLKFMFGTKDITNVDVFQRESRIFMGTDKAFSSTLYLMLLHNKNKHNFSSISNLLSNLPSEDYEIPLIYEYEVVYFGAESMFHEPEECDDDGLW